MINKKAISSDPIAGEAGLSILDDAALMVVFAREQQQQQRNNPKQPNNEAARPQISHHLLDFGCDLASSYDMVAPRSSLLSLGTVLYSILLA